MVKPQRMEMRCGFLNPWRKELVPPGHLLFNTRLSLNSVLCACVNLNPWLRGLQMEVKPESQASLLLLPLKPTPSQVQHSLSGTLLHWSPQKIPPRPQMTI